MKTTELIKTEETKGNIVLSTIDGLVSVPLKEFIKQSADGMLYDLNRDEATTLTFADDPKWVNDYACAKVIRELKNQIEQLQNWKESEIKIWQPILEYCQLSENAERLGIKAGDSISQYILSLLKSRVLYTPTAPKQLCPKCYGEAMIPQFGTTSSSTMRVCPVCNGNRTI